MGPKRPDNKRILCRKCGEVWTSRAPLAQLKCHKCGKGAWKDLEVAITDHQRSTRKGGAIVWSGSLGEEHFFLVSYPDGRLTASLK